MAYPLKMRFRNRLTNEIVTDKKKMVLLNTQGQPFIASSDGFYQQLDKKSSKEFILEIAISKNEKNEWVYIQVGH